MLNQIKSLFKCFWPVSIRRFNRTIQQILDRIDLKHHESCNQVTALSDTIKHARELDDKLLNDFNALCKNMLCQTQDIMNKSSDLEQRLARQISEVEQKLVGQLSESEQRLAGQMSESEQRLAGQMSESEHRSIQTMHVYDYFNKAILWQIYKNADESFDQERSRFYLNFPKAEGSLRLIQTSELYLVRELDKVCRENNIQYWLHGGSLLGAVRHKGFIPWDDDMDIGMMRSDIERLKNTLVNHSTIYLSELFDYYPTAMCRQFRLRFKDNRIPSFVDIFIFDHCKDGSQDNWMLVQAIRRNMIAELDSIIPQLKTYQFDKFITNDVDTALVETVYQKYNDIVRTQTKLCDEDADYVIWAIDNADNYPLEKNYTFAASDIFPLIELEFDGAFYYAPKKYNQYLQLMYGNYLDFPKNLLNYEHVPQSAFKSIEVINLLHDIIN